LSEPANFDGKAVAVAITENGLIGGSIYGGKSTIPAPVVWLGGQLNYLLFDEDGYVTGSAEDINGTDLHNVEVVGRTENSQPFYYQGPLGAGSTYVELTLLRGTTSGLAKAINNSSVIVGSSGGQAVRWPSPSSTPELLGGLTGAGWSVANDVNAGGDIVGTSDDGAGAAMPFLLRPGGYPAQLPLPQGATGGEAESINDEGHIVGHATFGPGEKHAVVWWHFIGKMMPRMSNVVFTKSISAAAPGQITVALLSDARLDTRFVDPRTLTLGNGVDADVSVARRSDGSPSVTSKDVNGDGLADLIASFDGRAVLNDEISKGARIAELMVLGMLMDRSNAVYSPLTLKIITR
jgi:hypothetical protein